MKRVAKVVLFVTILVVTPIGAKCDYFNYTTNGYWPEFNFRGSILDASRKNQNTGQAIRGATIGQYESQAEFRARVSAMRNSNRSFNGSYIVYESEVSLNFFRDPNSDSGKFRVENLFQVGHDGGRYDKGNRLIVEKSIAGSSYDSSLFDDLRIGWSAVGISHGFTMFMPTTLAKAKRVRQSGGKFISKTSVLVVKMPVMQDGYAHGAKIRFLEWTLIHAVLVKSPRR